MHMKRIYGSKNVQRKKNHQQNYVSGDVLFFAIIHTHTQEQPKLCVLKYFHFMDAIGCRVVILFSKRVNACINC